MPNRADNLPGNIPGRLNKTPAKIACCVGLLLCSISAHAQTKAETEAWILKQGEMNTSLLTYRIEGGELVSEVSLGPGAAAMGASTVSKAIPIREITRIAYVHTEKYLSYSLMCDRPCVYLIEEPDEKQPRFLFEIYRKLDASFPPRMNKALLKLVEQHGGKARLIPMSVEKEPF